MVGRLDYGALCTWTYNRAFGFDEDFPTSEDGLGLRHHDYLSPGRDDALDGTWRAATALLRRVAHSPVPCLRLGRTSGLTTDSVHPVANHSTVARHISSRRSRCSFDGFRGLVGG